MGGEKPSSNKKLVSELFVFNTETFDMARIKVGAPLKFRSSNNQSVRLENGKVIALVDSEDRYDQHLISFGKGDKKITILDTFCPARNMTPLGRDVDP